jgi:excisionase family DNA binding protein
VVKDIQHITIIDAAERLKLTRQRVFQFIKEGKLPAIKRGRDWLIDPADLKLVKNRRKPGRPKKNTKKTPNPQ